MMTEFETGYNEKSVEFNPFDGSEILSSFESTESQLEIWITCKIGGDDANRAFNLSYALKFNGDLDLFAFEKSLAGLVERHQSLRSAFTADGSQMIIFKDVTLNYSFQDLSDLTQSEMNDTITKVNKSEVLFIFDLLNGPLYKFVLLKLNDTEYYFTLTLHHIICDGWSVGVLLQDLGKLYNLNIDKVRTELKEADSFSEYAIEESEYINSAEYSNNESYWLNQFMNDVPVMNLPSDFDRPVPRTYKSARLDSILDQDLVSSLKLIGMQEGCSFVNTLLASFELFLKIYTGQKDIVIGLPAAGQLISGKFDLVGHCVNLIPIRSAPDTRINFIAYLSERKVPILDALEHQKITFGSLLKKLRIARDPSRIPLVPVVFNVNTGLGTDVSFRNLSYKILALPKEYENFELFFNVSDEKDSIQMECSYNTQIFHKDTILGMMSGYENLLKAIVSDPYKKIDSIVSTGIIGIRNAEFPDTINAISDNNPSETDKHFWLKQFEGELPLLNFPTDRLRPAVRSYKYGSVNKEINNSSVSDFYKFIASKKASKYSGLLSVLKVLLYRYTHQHDIVIGSRLFTLNQPQGHIVAIRSNIYNESSFETLLAETEASVVQIKKHLSYSLDSLIKELFSGDDTGNNKLFNVMMVMENSFPDTNEHHNDPDLIFVFNDVENHLQLNILYDSELFDEASIHRLSGHLEGLLSGLVANPLIAVHSVDYIGSKERIQLLVEFNDTKESYPDTLSITDIFEDQVAKTPDNIAIIFENEQITYRKLNTMANQIAGYLISKGIEDNMMVPIVIERSVMMLAGILGVLKTGASFVPIDPDYPADRIKFMLDDVGARLILSSVTGKLKLLNETNIELIELDRDWPVISEQSVSNIAKKVTPGHLAYIIHTSGSTGLPKGVMIEHRGVVNLLKSVGKKVKFNSESGILSVTTFSFDISYLEFFLPLLNGGRLIMVTREVAMDGFELAKAIGKNQITHLQGTPATWQILLDAGWENKENIIMLIGGESVKEDIKNSLTKIGELYNFYGPTETTIWSVSKKLELNEKVLIGKPLANTSVIILDENLQLVPVGVTGEICIGGPGLARGYLNRADLTTKKFINHPIEGYSGSKIYKTGDIGKWLPDGNIDCLGRMDDQVKIRGYRIELGEIENVIQKFPLVEGALVSVNESGSGISLIGYIKCQNEINLNDLMEYMKLKLPAYMIPVNFIVLNDFPLTSNGKINKRMLPKIPDTQFGEGIILFGSKLEKLIASIWGELLGINNIRVTDNFFEIGGHSLIAIRFIVRIENEIKIRLPMSSLFEYPTIEKLAKFIQSRDKTKRWKSLVNIKPSGDKKPIYLVHGLGLGVLIFNNIATYLDKNQPVYGIQALGIDGNDEPLETIEEMASFYVSEILEQNPNGPYKIGGLSAGGLIAFEMARQLQKLGKTVNKLIILDFNLINAQERKSGLGRVIDSIINSPYIIVYNIRSLIVNPKKTIKYYIYYWKLRFTTFVNRFRKHKKNELEGFHLYHQNAIRKHELALPKYEIKPYDGVIDLFISKDKPYYEKDLKYMGWKPFALKGINVYRVDGDHDDMILPPNNKKFARILQKILDEEA